MKRKHILIVSTLGLALALLSGCGGRPSAENKPDPTTEMQEAALLAHYQVLGDSIVAVAQANLLQHVSAAMAQGGPPNAVSFCNVHVDSIVLAMEEQFNCNIRRTSENYRNPANAPDEDELNLLQWYAGLGDGELTSTVWDKGDKVHYASPIRTTMAACLKCHGMPETDIDGTTLALISERYPDDKATGYTQGQLRGMWHLIFHPAHQGK